jgi:hypothetical protein
LYYQHKSKGTPRDFEKKLKMKWGGINTRDRGDLTAVVFKDKRNVTNIYIISQERVINSTRVKQTHEVRGQI